MKHLELKITQSIRNPDNMIYEVTALGGDFKETESVVFSDRTIITSSKIAVSLRKDSAGVCNVNLTEKVQKWLGFFASENNCNIETINDSIVIWNDNDINKI